MVPMMCNTSSKLIRVSEVLYSSDEERTPRQALQLYNNTWWHHELCRDLLTDVTSSRTNTFGIYLHALSSHASQQYELVSLKSVNTENQERLFGQTRRIATATSSRKPANIITNTFLWLQAKQKVGNLLHSTKKAYSKVKRAASGLPPLGCTEVKKQFISKRKHSWQVHLERINPFLLASKGIWWDEAQDSSRYIFFDGKTSQNTIVKSPSATLSKCNKDVIHRQNEAWQAILEGEIQIPAECIWNKEGQLITQACTTTAVTEFSLANAATYSGVSEVKNNQTASHSTIFVTSDHKTKVTRPSVHVHHDVSDIEYQTVATEPGTRNEIPDTSDLEHQTEVTEPNTHDATSLEAQFKTDEAISHKPTSVVCGTLWMYSSSIQAKNPQTSSDPI